MREAQQPKRMRLRMGAPARLAAGGAAVRRRAAVSAAAEGTRRTARGARHQRQAGRMDGSGGVCCLRRGRQRRQGAAGIFAWENAAGLVRQRMLL